jgi:hypothetical protein
VRRDLEVAPWIRRGTTRFHSILDLWRADNLGLECPYEGRHDGCPYSTSWLSSTLEVRDIHAENVTVAG